jgi:hypothetical protein
MECARTSISAERAHAGSDTFSSRDARSRSYAVAPSDNPISRRPLLIAQTSSFVANACREPCLQGKFGTNHLGQRASHGQQKISRSVCRRLHRHPCRVCIDRDCFGRLPIRSVSGAIEKPLHEDCESVIALTARRVVSPKRLRKTSSCRRARSADRAQRRSSAPTHSTDQTRPLRS